MSKATKIKIRSLYKSFNAKEYVLDNLNLDVKDGSALVILGRSGEGKSVLIKTMASLMKPDSGSIKIDDEEINNADARYNIISNRLINKSNNHNINNTFNNQTSKCGFLFQGGALFDSMSIEDNIAFFAIQNNIIDKNEISDFAAAKLKEVGLSSAILKLFPSELSGGMQKRVALARAIAHNPEIIFFDEPTTGLDPIMSNIINELIIKYTNKDLEEEKYKKNTKLFAKKLSAKKKTTTITITHDINSALAIADEVAFMHKGKIEWIGSATNLKHSGNEYLDQFINGMINGPIKY